MARWKLCDIELVRSQLTANSTKPPERLRCLEALSASSIRLLPIAQHKHVQALEHLATQFPNFGPVIDLYLLEVRLLARLREPLKLPTVLLQGPPGIGKTAFAMALAERLSFSMEMRSFAELTAGFLLSGMSDNWSKARHGLIAELCISAKEKTAPLILIDEIDKVGSGTYPPDRCLLSVLEPNTARRFRDENLELDLDVRPISWIFTSNRLDLVRPELKSRMTVVEVEAPTRAQMPAVIRSVDAAIRRQRPKLDKLFAPLSPEVIGALTVQSPRQLHAGLMQMYAAAANVPTGSRSAITLDVVRQVERAVPAPAKAANKSDEERPIFVAPQSWGRVQ
jgi:ATP-dependent Lon protease